MKHDPGLQGPPGLRGPDGLSLDSKTYEGIMEHLRKRDKEFFNKLEVRHKRIGFVMRFGIGVYMVLMFYFLVIR